MGCNLHLQPSLKSKMALLLIYSDADVLSKNIKYALLDYTGIALQRYLNFEALIFPDLLSNHNSRNPISIMSFWERSVVVGAIVLKKTE